MFMFIREFIHTFVVLEVEVEDHGLVVVHGRPQAVLDEGLPDDCVFLRGEAREVRQQLGMLCELVTRDCRASAPPQKPSPGVQCDGPSTPTPQSCRRATASASRPRRPSGI